MRRWMRRRTVAIVLAFVAGTTGCGGDRRAERSELGEVEFLTSGSPAAQEHFLQGVLLLHSFAYDDAREALNGPTRPPPRFFTRSSSRAMVRSMSGESDRLDSLQGPASQTESGVSTQRTVTVLEDELDRARRRFIPLHYRTESFPLDRREDTPCH